MVLYISSAIAAWTFGPKRGGLASLARYERVDGPALVETLAAASLDHGEDPASLGNGEDRHLPALHADALWSACSRRAPHCSLQDANRSCHGRCR